MAAHLVLQIRDAAARQVPAAAHIAEHVARRASAIVPLGQHTVQRLAGDLGDRVPERDLDGPDGDRALAVAAGFLPLHHAGDHLGGSKIAAVGLEQGFRIGTQDARDEALAHLRPAGIAAGGIKREAGDRRSGTAFSRMSRMRIRRFRSGAFSGNVDTGFPSENATPQEFHSIFGILASRMTLAQRAISALSSTANSSGVLATGVKPMAARRSLTSGRTIMRAISR